MLQYAGVDLLTPDPGGWLESFLQRTALDSLDLFGASPVAACDQRTQAVGSHQPITPYPIPNYRAAPPLKLNQLYWPSGAARWSTFVGLIDSDGLDKIRASLGTKKDAGTTAQVVSAQSLIIADSDFDGPIGPRNLIDGDGRAAVVTSMYFLEPRAVSTPKGRETLWLLPLVDVRYHWRNKRLPHRVPDSLASGRVTASNVLETWSGILSLLQESIDSASSEVKLDFVPPKLPDEYFYPDRSELMQEQHNAAIVLDSLAHSIGRRFIRQFNGVCEIIDATESLSRYAAHVPRPSNTGGGIAMLSSGKASAINATSTAEKPLDRQAVYPEFVDVVYRKLVEYDIDDVPEDEPNSTTTLPTDYSEAQVLAGVGTRTIRNKSMLKSAHNIVEGASKAIYTPSWVGLHLWHDGTGTCAEPPGIIDNSFYGDRYFRLAERITDDFVAWKAQQHEIDLPGFQPWLLSGFDDAVTWDHQRGSTHIRSHSNDFGVSTQLVQVHRQCSFDPNMVVGVISSAWTLYPVDDDAASCELEIEKDDTPTVDTLPGDLSDVFDYTWQWAECFVRPFIPTDPWAATNSIQYARTMVSAGKEIVATTRSQSIIQDLLAQPTHAPTTLPLGDADDRVRNMTSASGVAYLRRYGCEWQMVWIDCEV